ncbi:hypothetical protein M9H77_06969 [Catharanthus roseus]|uniref:Uncharacterized protein n=1 Tax=Catharanthus roseus TaxID=4058 RepID=A0ACC0BTU3_CATRO|nr:hypothetical protein M9H77_06969 [Catharanthus roseus]
MIVAEAVEQVVKYEAALVLGAKVLLLLVATTLSTPAQVPSTEIKKEQITNPLAKFLVKGIMLLLNAGIDLIIHISQTFPQALVALNLSNNDLSLYTDLEATLHMTNDAVMLYDLKLYKVNDGIYVGNGNKLTITHTSETCMGKLNLRDVLVFQTKKNLVSFHKSTADDTISPSPTRIDTKVASTTAIFTVDDITPSVNSNTPVVNYAPTGTSTFSPDTAYTVNEDGITVDTDNAPTVDNITRSTDAAVTVNSSDLTIDAASLSIDVDSTKEDTLPITLRHHCQALKVPRWVEATKEELEALHSNRTWSLVSQPTTTNVVGSKWV